MAHLWLGMEVSVVGVAQSDHLSVQCQQQVRSLLQFGAPAGLQRQGYQIIGLHLRARAWRDLRENKECISEREGKGPPSQALDSGAV